MEAKLPITGGSALFYMSFSDSLTSYNRLQIFKCICVQDAKGEGGHTMDPPLFLLDGDHERRDIAL